jgi:hypothetical protein
MGTIIPRKRKSGSTGYHAQLFIKRKGTIVHRESRTFDRRQAAAAWLEKRETELVKPGAIEREKTPDPTLGSVIDRYTEESIKDIGRTKTQVLTCDQTLRYREPTVFDHYERRNHCVRQSTRIEGHTADRRQLSVASCGSLRDRPAGVGLST